MEKDLIIIGDGETADIAYEYFSHDSSWSVIGFGVEEEYLSSREKFGLPVFGLKELREKYPPKDYEVFVAISYVGLNQVRERLFSLVKSWGYHCASYVSSRAFVWRTAKIGENCMIFEGNVIQHGVVIEDNVILWSGNHIGHQSTIKQSAYISSHVVISGFCEVGERSFLGVNSTLVDNVNVANNCMIAAGAVVRSNTDQDGIYLGDPAKKREGVRPFVISE